MDKCPSSFYSEYGNSTALCSIFIAFSKNTHIIHRKFVFFIMKSAPIISFTCLLINVLHLAILYQTSMRTSSINWFLSFVAISDILFLLFPIQLEIVSIYNSYQPCPILDSYPVLLIKTIFDALQFFSRRCSIWFSLSIAVIRTLVIRNPIDPKYSKLSKPSSVVYVLLCIIPLFLPISILGFLKYKLIENPENIHCSQSNITSTKFLSKYSDMFSANDYLVFRIYSFIDPILSKLIPCLLFPVFTFLLVREFLKTETNRAKMMNSGKTHQNSGRKTKLVLYLTITFFIADFPLGIVIFAKLFFNPHSAIVYGFTV
ncbi:Protein CBG27037 [Caenorhabditis briggsae]|uniref:Protein CBG27037 n=1 Tax=Caenorhabditis briggsae TaxID=6238 RepID=B6IMA1_CAEBR|nr:Protein CBG27037 [Caenorhabditis briggsae]CAS01031.1 Protein CBG27037 [Caenorhabditis briggsae]